jgi:toxin ParE1/3/4
LARIHHTFRARLDLLELWEHIAAVNPAAADRVFARLQARTAILETFPEAGRLRPEIAPDARAVVEAPYLILYRLVDDGVQIVRVLHGARRITERMFEAGVSQTRI